MHQATKGRFQVSDGAMQAVSEGRKARLLANTAAMAVTSQRAQTSRHPVVLALER